MKPIQENIQISDFIKIPFELFKAVGIRLFKYHPDEKKPFREKFALIAVILNLTFHLIFQNLVLYFRTNLSLIQLTEFACYEGFFFNSFCKVLAVWKGRSILHGVVMKMEEICPKTEAQIQEYRVGEYYKKIYLYMRALTIHHFSTTTMFNLFPITQSIVEYMFFGKVFVLRFPFIIYYPFDETRLLAYPIVYSYQAMGAYSLSCLYLGSDLLLVSMVHYMCMHFEFLANKIRNFEPVGTDEDVNQLKVFIRYHKNILSLSIKINEVFNVAILMNYIASCGVICMIGFQITVGSEILDLFKFVCFLITSLVHVYFICYFGTNLLETSGAISKAVFSQKWYLGNNKYKKMLPLLIRRSHKPVYLTAFKFFTVSMESFKTLITTSYQFFTLIKTKYDEE